MTILGPAIIGLALAAPLLYLGLGCEDKNPPQTLDPRNTYEYVRSRAEKEVDSYLEYTVPDSLEKIADRDFLIRMKMFELDREYQRY